jgi:phage terminase Nu1 subunit (DNA packaging protein)
LGLIVTKIQLAEILGVSDRTLTTWQKNGLPIKVDGARGEANKYDTEDVIEWMIARDVNAAIGGTGGGSEKYDYETERARLTFHQANKVALEEDILRGTSILSSDVEAFQSRMIAAFRAKCLALPTKTAPRVVYLDSLAEVEAELRSAVYDALTELSEFKFSDYGIRSVSDADSADNTAAESDSQLMG